VPFGTVRSVIAADSSSVGGKLVETIGPYDAGAGRIPGGGTMRIVENTDTVLRLKDRTLWVSIVCIGAAAFMMAAIFFGQGDHRIAYPASFFALFGLMFLRSTDAVFDKKARLLRLEQLNVFRVRRRQLGFDDISDVRVDYGPTSASTEAGTYRLDLIVGSETVPLTAAYEGGLDRHEAMREAIMETLFADKLQPGEADPVRALVQEGRLVDAVRILRLREGLDLAQATARVAELKTGA
jgi:hypothetical protein